MSSEKRANDSGDGPPAKRSRSGPSLYKVIVSTSVYKVMVRGVTFELSDDMLRFDSPNYFTAAFGGDFSEADERIVDLGPAHDPDLFAIIASYMSGYDVLPLDRTACPRTMSVATTTVNLAKMAVYLGLDRLESLLGDKSKDKPSCAPSLTLFDHPKYPLAGRDLLAEYKVPVKTDKTDERATEEDAEDPDSFYVRVRNVDVFLKTPKNEDPRDRSIFGSSDWPVHISDAMKDALSSRMEEICGRPLHGFFYSFLKDYSPTFDIYSTNVPLTLTDRAKKDGKPSVVRCPLSDLTGVLFYRFSVDHVEDFLPVANRSEILSWFGLPQDSEAFAESDEEHPDKFTETIPLTLLDGVFEACAATREIKVGRETQTEHFVRLQSIVSLDLCTRPYFNELVCKE